MNEHPLILIIDDEVSIRRLLEISFQSNQYDTQEAGTGKQGLALAAQLQPAMIILDLGLPDQSGHNVLMQLREWYTGPIVILSVQKNEDDIVRALDNGANDYVIKPFRTGELMARVRLALRSKQDESTEGAIRKFGELELDISAHTLSRKNEIIKLTVTEYKLISLLMTQAGKVLTHHYLLREIWGPGYLNQTQYLRVFIAQLRKKIEKDPDHPIYILTESGIGYRFHSE